MLRARVFVVASTGRVALVERHRAGQHYWVVPGGGVEPGESGEAAALREVREELGIEVRLRHPVASCGPQLFFLASVDGEPGLALGGPELERSSEDNRYALHWVALAAAGSLPLRPAPLRPWLRSVARFGWPASLEQLTDAPGL